MTSTIALDELAPATEHKRDHFDDMFDLDRLVRQGNISAIDIL